MARYDNHPGFTEAAINARLRAPAGDPNKLTEHGARRLREMRDLDLTPAQWDRLAAERLQEDARVRVLAARYEALIRERTDG